MSRLSERSAPLPVPATRARFTSAPRRLRVAVGRVSTHDALVGTLRRQIIEGVIPAGAHLAEMELAEEHGVSRQSVRSALAELVHLGLLERAPHRGVWVPIMTMSQLRDLWWVRAIVEREAMRQAIAVGADWSGVRAAVQSIASLTVASSWADAVEADLAFHRALVEAAGSPHLARVHTLLMSELSLALAGNINNEPPGLMSGEHQRLLDAFQAGDPEAAATLLDKHLEEGLDIGTRVRIAETSVPIGSEEDGQE